MFLVLILTWDLHAFFIDFSIDFWGWKINTLYWKTMLINIFFALLIRINTRPPGQVLRLPHRMTRRLAPRHIWNVISNARSNKCHLQTHHILRLPRKMTIQHLAEICGKQLKRHFQCAADPNMIRTWSDHVPRPFPSVRNPPRNRGYFSRSGRTVCIEKYKISRSGYLSKFHQVLRLPRKVTLQLHQVLRLPRKVTLELHQVLRLPRKVTLQLHQVLRLPRKLTLELHQVLRLPRKVTLELHQVLRLPRKVTLELHQVLRLPRKVTLDLHQVLRLPHRMTRRLAPRHIWNVISNARSNKCHLQTHHILRLPRKMTIQHMAEICGKQLKRHFQCAADPNMIRSRSETVSVSPQPATQQRLLFALRTNGLYWKIQHFALRLSFQISPSTAPTTKSDTSTSPSTAPTTQSDTWTSPSTAPTTQSDTWPSPTTVPTTQSDTWNFTNYCAYHAKWHLKLNQVLRLPRKVTVDLSDLLRSDSTQRFFDSTITQRSITQRFY